jgi:PAS domain S-box-containing protein
MPPMAFRRQLPLPGSGRALPAAQPDAHPDLPRVGIGELGRLLGDQDPGLLQLDAGGRICAATDRARAGLELESAPPGARPALAALVASRDARLLQDLLQAGQGGELRLTLLGGTGIKLRLEPRRDGSWLGLLLERRQRNREQERLDWLSRVVEHSPVSVVVTDAQGNIEYVNAKFCDVTGYSAEDVLGLNPRVLKSGAQDPEVYGDLWNTVLAGREWRGELHNRRKDGSLFWESATISGLRDPDGRIRHLVAIKEDISERKRLEEELLLSRDLLQQAVDGILDPILLFDADGNLALVNEAASLDPMLDAGAMAGLDCLHLNPQRPGCRLCGQGDCLLERARREGRPLRHEIERLGVDGTPRQIEVHFNPLDQGRGELLWLRDQTERHQLERERLRSGKLEAVGRLAGSLAHDFNNLLAAVVGELELVSRQLPGDHSQQERLQRALDATLRSRRLTQRLLTFASGGEPKRRPQALHTLLKEVRSEACERIGLQVDLLLPDDPAAAAFDSEQLGQVLRELIQNAAEAGAQTLRIDLERRSRSWPEGPGDGDWLCLRLADDGPGIPEELIGRLFEPYSVAGREHGGLGLAACWSIVRAHDGMLQVESRPGEGAVFDIWLPEVRLPEPEAPSSSVAAERAGARILVLEDEEAVARMLLEVLAHLGHHAVWTRRGEDTIARYRQAEEEGRPFDLVLSDLTIVGGLGGEETMRRLRAEFPRLKSIVSSGYSSNPVMARPREYGFDAVVPKPWRIDELERVIARLLTA